MNWILISLLAYFLISLQMILDKFLISSKRISHPAIYAFYSGVLSLFAFFLFPFGFSLISPEQIFSRLAAGVIFIYAILSLFFAFRKGEVSRITAIVGATIPIFTYSLSFFFLEERLDKIELIGVFFLIIGGFWIALDLNKNSRHKFLKGFFHSILTGFLLAISFTLFKNFYERDSFINVYIWTRFGVMAGAVSLFFSPAWRKAIVGSILKFKKPSSQNKSSGLIFVLNKTLGGVGSVIKEFATAIGSVTIVNALISIEYVFVFIMGSVFSLWLPKIFHEKTDIKNMIQKISAIIIIAIGIILISWKK